MEHRHDRQHAILDRKADRVGVQAAVLCSTVERWLYSDPLGLPVVPEVWRSDEAVFSSKTGRVNPRLFRRGRFLVAQHVRQLVAAYARGQSG